MNIMNVDEGIFFKLFTYNKIIKWLCNFYSPRRLIVVLCMEAP